MTDTNNNILRMFEKGSKPPIRYNNSQGFAYLDSDTFRNGKVQWDVLAEKYGTGKDGGVYIGFEDDGSPRKDNSLTWQEINFGSANPVPVRDNTKSQYISLDITAKLDSYSIQALRRGVLKRGNIVENAIQGILVKDGYFLLGSRGGQDQPGKLQPMPGGSVTWKESYAKNPFEDTLQSESLEEVGSKVIKPELRGIFNQVGTHINRQWLYVGEPEKDLDEIMDNLEQGRRLYLREKDRTGDEAIARAALRESDYPDDAWENTDVHKFGYDADNFLQLLSDGNWINPHRVKMELIGTLPADLYIAGITEFGEEFRKEADKLNFRSGIRFGR